MGDLAVPPNRKEDNQAGNLWVLRASASTHHFPGSGSSPRPSLWAGTALNPAAQLGAQTCSSLSGKNLGLQPRSDLIKAATAHRVVTRSRGQPEKVVTFLVPCLTYRPI